MSAKLQRTEEDGRVRTEEQKQKEMEEGVLKQEPEEAAL